MIRVQPIEGTWQVLGRDLFPGAYPQDVAPAWGPAGPESLGFSIYRAPQRVHADLLPFTPVEWYPSENASGEPLWSGYTQQAPPGGAGEFTNVSCVGWHYYREDDPRPACYVHSDVSAFQDMRSAPEMHLPRFTVGGVATVGDGSTVLAWPKDYNLAINEAVGVYMDFGADPTCWPIILSLDVEWFASSLAELYARASDEPQYAVTDGGGIVGTNMNTFGGFPSVGAASGSNTLTSTSISVRRRYVSLFLNRTTSTVTTTADYGVKIKAVRIFRETAYASSGLSVFKASQGIEDTLSALPLLSADTGEIEATTFSIPHAAWITEDTTVRQRQESLNDYHGYRLGVNAQQRIFFKAQPSVPRLQVDALASGVSYRSTSTNDGSEVYNHVSVRGQSGSGNKLRVDRWLEHFVTLASIPTDVSPTNPSFDTDTTGWTNMIRRTSGFDSAPAAGEASAFPAVGDMTGASFTKNSIYVLTLRIKATNIANIAEVTLRFGASTDYVSQVSVHYDVDYHSLTMVWQPSATTAAANVKFTIQSALRGGDPLLGAPGVYVDTMAVNLSQAGVLTKRSRKRSFTLNVAAPTDFAAMDGLAEAWLLAHRSVPHKATLSIEGAPVWGLEAGRAVPASELGRYYGEMIRVLSVPDPDTGALQSRDGIIASVQGVEPAQLAIDTERRSLEALMARMGVVAAP